MYETYEQCKAELLKNVDGDYDKFNNPIVNCEYPTYGIRTPVIKKLAKSVPISAREQVLNGFFADNDLAYDTVLFAGVLAARKGDYQKSREYLSRLVPLFGSWPRTLLMMSFETLARNSYGRWAQSAVIASVEVTARRATARS